jgi:hypothetical protein
MEAILATPANMRKYADRGPIAYSFATGEEYSATAGDYFMQADDEPLKDANGDPMELIVKRMTVTRVNAIDTDEL